jgi:hypothetical protein
MKPCGHISNIDSMESDGGYCDYAEDGMPRSKQYAIKIMFEDGMAIDGYIKCMAAGTVSDPFSRYDTCIVLWPKSNRMIEDKEKNMKGQIKLTEAELKQVVKEAAMNLIKEYYTVRSMHGKRKMKSGNPIKDKEIIDTERNAKMAKAVGKQVEKTSKVQEEGSDSGIHIKPENKGKFTATKKATGKSTEELTHSKNPLTKKRAVFAQNAKKWAKK